MKKRLTIEEITLRLRNINPNIIIRSTEYINAHTHLLCFCNICNHEWMAQWSNLAQGRGCPKCGNKLVTDGTRLSLEEVKNRLLILAPNLTLISDKYVNANTKLNFHCDCGNDFEMVWGNISQGRNCPVCSMRAKSGENSVLWKGGRSALYSWLREHAIYQWKEDSKKACGYKCVITGERFDALHHLVGFGIIANEAIARCNLTIHKTIGEYTSEELELLKNTCLELHYKYGLGVCLTKKVHIEFHKTYGYGDNIPEQFEEFKKNYKAS